MFFKFFKFLKNIFTKFIFYLPYNFYGSLTTCLGTLGRLKDLLITGKLAKFANISQNY